MKPINAIRRQIILNFLKDYPEEDKGLPLNTDEEVSYAYYEYDDALCDTVSEFRGGYDVVTEIPCETSRHYESQSVAARLDDGTWVGWTYWYGGGKHGDPGSINWMSEAYYLDCVEKQEVKTVRYFTKKND